MKVLVTGATGFLGGHLTRRLIADGWDVDLVVRDASSPSARKLESLGARLLVATEPTQVHKETTAARPDHVVHLATHYLKSHTANDIAPLARSNIELGMAILDAASTMSTPVVTASSYFQFSLGTAAPASLYAATKQAFAAIVDYYRQKAALRISDVILYDTYGPNDVRDKLIPLLVGAARTGDPVRLGNPDQRINLTYVDDVIDGLLILLEGDSPDRTTIRVENPPTVAEIVRTLACVTETELNVSFTPEAPIADLPLTAGDWPLPTGWAARVPLDQGLRITALRSASERDDSTTR